MSDPVAYFITFTTYGTWLHGRDPGSIDCEHNEYGMPFLPADGVRESESAASLKQEPYQLDEARQAVVLQTLREVAQHRKWHLHAVHVRSNHAHIVVTATQPIEKVMGDFKAWCSRRLREQFQEEPDRKRWTEHGSTRYLWNDDSLTRAIAYTVHQQGRAMAVYQSSEPEA